MKTIGVIKEPNGDIEVRQYMSGIAIISQPDIRGELKDDIFIEKSNVKKLIIILKKIK